MYNNAYVAIEANNMGLTTCYYLYKTYKYKNVHMSKSIQKMQGGARDSRWSVDEGQEIPGFQTTSKTRPFLVDSLRRYMREKEVKLNSPRIMVEFDTFIIKPNGKAEHEKGCNDDLIIALAIALFIRDSEWERVNRSKSLYQAMLSSWSSSKVNYRGTQKEIDNTADEIQKLKFEQKEKDMAGYLPIMFSKKSMDQKQDDIDNLDDSWLYD